ncbi:MAG: hypothetical protein MJK04_22280 [Psychrosphaera sp.]|nr:hypothetical protein [Psychrosphaera sp.]
MTVSKILVVIIIFLSCSVRLVLAKSLEVNNGKLFFNDVSVPTNINFKDYDYNAEATVLFSHTDGKGYSIVKIISLTGHIEFWLFIAAQRSFLHIVTHPTNFKVHWLSDDVFMLQRKHMGTSISTLNLIEPDKSVMTSDYIKDFLAFDLHSGLILSWSFANRQLIASDFTYSDSDSLPDNMDLKEMKKNKKSSLDVQLLGCEILVKDLGSNKEDVEVALNKAQCAEVRRLLQRDQQK